MDLIEGLRTRRSTKGFSQAPVAREALLELVDIARHSPSGGNKNAWRFVITTDRAKLDRLSTAHPHCRWLATAPAGVAVVVDPAATQYWLEDSCVAAYSVWLAAVGRGLGVAWAAMYQSWDPVESQRRQAFVREVFSIPDNFNAPMVLGVGYPQAVPPTRKRPSLEEVVAWECYADGARPQA
ncbi:MAG: nitroreductase family protein [Chloroflexi bacterium]|nr:nitroreductase family protein [Chloroflexota bacterium]